MTRPTGNPVGRPKTKEYSTLLARVPQDLVDRVKRYASLRRLPIADLIRDGLAWRIDEGDPHNAFLYDTNRNEYSSNTDIQALAQSADFLLPGMLDDEVSTVPSDRVPAEDLDARPSTPVAMPPQTDERTESAPVPPFDTTKYALGEICKHGHAYQGTGQSLRRLADHECLECQRTRAQAARQRKRQAAPVA